MKQLTSSQVAEALDRGKREAKRLELAANNAIASEIRKMPKTWVSDKFNYLNVQNYQL